MAGNELEGERESKMKDVGFGTSSLKSSRWKKKKKKMLCFPRWAEGKGGAEIVSRRGDVGCRRCTQAEPHAANEEDWLVLGGFVCVGWVKQQRESCRGKRIKG